MSNMYIYYDTRRYFVGKRTWRKTFFLTDNFIEYTGEKDGETCREELTSQSVFPVYIKLVTKRNV